MYILLRNNSNYFDYFRYIFDKLKEINFIGDFFIYENDSIDDTKFKINSFRKRNIKVTEIK